MSAHRLVIKDAFWQIFGRVLSALCGFVVLKIISPYLWPLGYGDYATILKFFAYRSALADFGLYVIAVKKLWVLKTKLEALVKQDSAESIEAKRAKQSLEKWYGQFVWTRVVIMFVVYFVALLLAYFLPAYTANIYLVWWLPIGMVFSASFMMSGIVQLPLQLFWKMKKLSVALILARLAQITILVITVFVLFPHVSFDGSTPSIIAFGLIMLSVLASGVTQWLYVRITGRKYIKLKVRFNFPFIKETLKQNWQYGLSYFLSSFHTLIVLFFLSLYFPTVMGFKYAGIWWLALALLEIFLIVPSALGNSMLHKVAGYSLYHKRKSFGSFLSLIFWIGGVVFLNFLLFNKQLVLLISGPDFLWTSFANPGSNIILPFLWVVLWMSFLKQVFNYIFVATDKQNVLLWINMFGVLVWLFVALQFTIWGFTVWLWLIPNYGIKWWIVVQILLETLFMTGAFVIALKHKVFPKIPRKHIIASIGVFWVFGVSWRYFIPADMHWMIFLLIAGVFNLAILAVSLPIVKKTARGLTSGDI